MSLEQGRGPGPGVTPGGLTGAGIRGESGQEENSREGEKSMGSRNGHRGQ